MFPERLLKQQDVREAIFDYNDVYRQRNFGRTQCCRLLPLKTSKLYYQRKSFFGGLASGLGGTFEQRNSGDDENQCSQFGEGHSFSKKEGS